MNSTTLRGLKCRLFSSLTLAINEQNMKHRCHKLTTVKQILILPWLQGHESRVIAVICNILCNLHTISNIFAKYKQPWSKHERGVCIKSHKIIVIDFELKRSCSPPLGNFADISYLEENFKPHLLRDVCTLCSGALVSDSLLHMLL